MPTIRDVAADAGVSVSTVSKGLHGKGRMREETRQRIIASARRLGFRPNTNSTAGAGPREFTIGVMTRAGYIRYTAPLLGGIEDSLTAGMTRLILCDARRDVVRERHYLDSLIAQRVDGLIMTGLTTDPIPSVTSRMPFPVVYAYITSDDPTDASITVDDEHGGYLAARQLVRQGCTSLLHITGPADLLAVRERIAGARRALAQHDLELPDQRIFHTAFRERAAFDSLPGLLADADIDGIFCGNDLLARGVADRLQLMGVSVPDDIAIVGYGNWALMAADTRPPLTSVDMNLYQIGRAAGLAMVKAIRSRPEPGVTKVSCALAVRDSCPAPPEGDPVWYSDAPMALDA